MPIQGGAVEARFWLGINACIWRDAVGPEDFHTGCVLPTNRSSRTGRRARGDIRERDCAVPAR